MNLLFPTKNIVLNLGDTITFDQVSGKLSADRIEGDFDGKKVSFDNAESGLEATNVQDAIDELANKTPEDIYTKEESDDKFATKTALQTVANNVYTKQETDTKINNVTNWRISEKFDGTYDHWRYAGDQTLLYDESAISAIVPMVSGGIYHIVVQGTFNRFAVATANEIEVGKPVTRIIATNNPNPREEYTYENTSGAKYLLILLNYGTTTFNCNTSVEEKIVSGEEFTVNGVDVLVKERLGDYLATLTDGNYLKEADVEFTNNALNRGQITTDLGKLAICSMKNGLKYLINLNGTINRFVLAVSNEKTIGATYTIVYNAGITSDTNSSLNEEFVNSGNYKYLLIFYYYGAPSTPISLDVQELSYNGKMTVSGIEVALREEVPLTYDNYMSDLSVESVANASALYALYDALVTDHPNYISKNVLGQDSAGNNLVEYVLTTGNYNSQTGQRTEDTEIAKPKILIVTGIHGYERSSVISTYQFIRDLCNAVPKITDIRENYIIKVVPCACPSGFNADTRANSNGVNINRNFANNWTYTGAGTDNYSGASAADQLETQIIQNWIDANDDAILYVDFHNSGFDNEVSYIQGSNTYARMSDIKNGYLKQVYMTSAYWKEVEAFASNLIFAYTGGEDQIASSNCYAHITGGLLSILLETSWNQNGTGKHSKMTIKTGAEALGNMLIGILGTL